MLQQHTAKWRRPNMQPKWVRFTQGNACRVHLEFGKLCLIICLHVCSRGFLCLECPSRPTSPNDMLRFKAQFKGSQFHDDQACPCLDLSVALEDRAHPALLPGIHESHFFHLLITSVLSPLTYLLLFLTVP